MMKTRLQYRTHRDQRADQVLDLLAKTEFGEEVYAMVQKWDELILARQKPLETGDAGRVFGEKKEVRWVKEGGGYTVWELSEATGSEGEEARAREARYYLLGEPKPMKGADGSVRVEWREAHLAKDFAEILEPWGLIPDGDKRAYVQVREYYAGAPGEGLTAEELERALNRPRLLAHRLVGVGVGVGAGAGR